MNESERAEEIKKFVVELRKIFDQIEKRFAWNKSESKMEIVSGTKSIDELALEVATISNRMVKQGITDMREIVAGIFNHAERSNLLDSEMRSDSTTDES